MNENHITKNQFRRVLIGIFLLALLPLLVVQIAGATPPVQDAGPPVGEGMPGLSKSGAPIGPVFVDQSADEMAFEQNSATAAIAVWYGNVQNFGDLGNPQKWVDILGNASSPAGVKTLHYRLNSDSANDWIPLNLGSDGRRLYRNGDFHIELDIDELKNGANKVDIALYDGTNQTTVKSVLVNYSAGNSWPENYIADWSSSTNPQEIAQVVDGYWVIQNDKLQLAEGAVGYDRLVALGEFDQWSDYEVTVPITIKAIDPSGFGWPSSGPGIGLMVRWQGYYQTDGEQPRQGWQDLGAIAWNRYALNNNNQVTQGLQMIGYSQANDGAPIPENPEIQLKFGETYIFKVSTQTVPDAGDIYRLKVWPQGQDEPGEWALELQTDIADKDAEPATGSVVIISHHVDAEIGNVVVRPTSDITPTLSLQKSGDGDLPSVTPAGPYEYGDEVTVQANPTFPSVLGRWEGDASGNQENLTIALTKDTTDITAVYVPFNNTGELTVNTLGGDGTVEVTPDQVEYLVGQQVTVTAVPAAGYEFEKWVTSNTFNTNAATDSTENPYTFVFGEEATSVAASFVAKPTYNLTKSTTPEDGGSILTDPDQASFYKNTVVEVTAQGAAGYEFSGWDEPYDEQPNPFFILMDGAKSVSANFEEVSDTFTLTVTPGANGQVLVSPKKDKYLYGELVTLTAVANSGYMLGGWGGDLAGNTNPVTFGMFGNYSISAVFIEETNPVSDDFNRCVLNNGLWTVSDPLGDSTFNMTGTKLEISVPAGKPHDLYNDIDTVPRVLTPADDESQLGLEVKFDSAVNKQYQAMGILVQENENKKLRFDFYSDGANTFIYAASIENGTSTTKINNSIAAGSPLYMKIERDGDTWKQFYSTNGMNWTQAGSFTFDMTVKAAGLFAGNPGPAPAFTAQFDFFFNSANPIVPQDTNKNTLSFSTTGEGTISASPEKDSYECGEIVEITATPANDNWFFVGWGGDLAGLNNPEKVKILGSQQISARFSTDPNDILGGVYLPIIVQP
jgi:hypothetical protein